MQQNLLKNQFGLTLVELAIVMLIISLLTGVIITVDEILHRAKVRIIMDEFNQYNTAVNNFYLKYNALPGDMINATDYWYNADYCTGTSGTAGECNGNDNGYIEESCYTTISASSDEAARAWQHLYLANFISQPYQGQGSGVVNQWPTVGVNAPTSRYGSTCEWNFFFPTLYTLTIWTNSLTIATCPETYTPIDAYSIDVKMDDGIPKTGAVISMLSDDTISVWGAGGEAGLACVIGSTNTYNTTTQATSWVSCWTQFIMQTVP